MYHKSIIGNLFLNLNETLKRPTKQQGLHIRNILLLLYITLYLFGLKAEILIFPRFEKSTICQ